MVHDNFELLGEAPPWPGWGADMLDVKPLFIAAGLNLSGLSSGTVHRAVGISGDGHVHDVVAILACEERAQRGDRLGEADALVKSELERQHARGVVLGRLSRQPTLGQIE